ncbi:enoyl-CoA hydratase [Litorisediminicola beolgyonensis]|uniref:Enoyl-CoA hydratase domain-containing protein 3, mitochondrial n=1 Tax=Litorisediminicola beolgyonensis TaxID=1173614 RepID=A0ABW3ZH00_9RHOB
MAILERCDDGAITHLRLNAPDTLNALSDGMLDALHDTCDALEAEAGQPGAPRVVILSGAGRAFCAGHHLREMQAKRQAPDGGAAAIRALFDRCGALMTRLQRLPQPVIAQVHGIATAAGCQLVATCDLAVAADTTRFGVNGVNIGLFCSTPMVALSRNLPRKQAFEMLTTGTFIDAERALTLGLVNRVVPEDALGEATQELAETIAAKLGAAVRIGKRAFYEQLDMSIDDAYRHTGDVMLENMMDKNTEEGINAFLEKRSPDWTQ